MVIDPEIRFWAKVEKTDGCWLWLGTRDRDGYGSFRGSRSDEKVRAHRWSYERYVGPIPDGLTIDHLCRNPSCVNPEHMEPVTKGENTLRGNGAPARNARKTHCNRGHPFDEANTRIWKGKRACRECGRLNQAAYRKRQMV